MVMVMGMVKLLMLLLLVQPIWPIRQRHLTHVSFALKWRNTAVVVAAEHSDRPSAAPAPSLAHTQFTRNIPRTVCVLSTVCGGEGKGENGHSWPESRKSDESGKKRKERRKKRLCWSEKSFPQVHTGTRGAPVMPAMASMLLLLSNRGLLAGYSITSPSPPLPLFLLSAGYSFVCKTLFHTRLCVCVGCAPIVHQDSTLAVAAADTASSATTSRDTEAAAAAAVKAEESACLSVRVVNTAKRREDKTTDQTGKQKRARTDQVTKWPSQQHHPQHQHQHQHCLTLCSQTVAHNFLCFAFSTTTSFFFFSFPFWFDCVFVSLWYFLSLSLFLFRFAK